MYGYCFYVPIWIAMNLTSAFYVAFSLFFWSVVVGDSGYCSWTVAALSYFFVTFITSVDPTVLFMVPQISLFSNFFVKIGSHSTIHTFKNYFATVFSVSVFNFSNNKFNSNGPYVPKYLFTSFCCEVKSPCNW